MSLNSGHQGGISTQWAHHRTHLLLSSMEGSGISGHPGSFLHSLLAHSSSSPLRKFWTWELSEGRHPRYPTSDSGQSKGSIFVISLDQVHGWESSASTLCLSPEVDGRSCFTLVSLPLLDFLKVTCLLSQVGPGDVAHLFTEFSLQTVTGGTCC